ncbi:hypothetical protein PROFUN_12037 [Planoprotostelium fungivorum]|uniref:Uncharacterized protein n=1 Tax=Planoprotostelium fungivorum TaxID=1890364 RepID=A0A2P6MXJ3_9EUKA|nr:hypothetical protein PROFUN_12037 [Planoprotostelium fungivorum]
MIIISSCPPDGQQQTEKYTKRQPTALTWQDHIRWIDMKISNLALHPSRARSTILWTQQPHTFACNQRNRGATSPLCNHCGVDETREHLLLECPPYHHIRCATANEVRKLIWETTESTTTLLIWFTKPISTRNDRQAYNKYRRACGLLPKAVRRYLVDIGHTSEPKILEMTPPQAEHAEREGRLKDNKETYSAQLCPQRAETKTYKKKGDCDAGNHEDVA